MRCRALCLAALLVSAEASALELEFDEPAPCPTDEISFRVERALERPLSSVAGPSFRVSIERSGAGFQGRVDVSNLPDTAQRRFTATTCDELIDTLALTIVLAIGGDRADERPAPPGPASDAPVEPASTAPRATGAPALADDSSVGSTLEGRGPQLAPFASLALDTGSLPALGMGPALGLDIAWRAAELRVLASLLLPREGTVDTAGGGAAGADIGLVSGAALGCVPLATSASSLTIAVCAGLELGRMSAEGTRVDIARESSSLWVAPRAEAVARWSLPPPGLELELQLAALAPLVRDEFVLRDIGSVHQAAPVVGRAGAGVRYGFEP